MCLLFVYLFYVFVYKFIRLQQARGRYQNTGIGGIITYCTKYICTVVKPYAMVPALRYGHKTQASLLSLEFLSKQLEAGLSPMELHFYRMLCLSMWDTQIRSQPLSLYWRLISSEGPMIDCSLAQECEGERKGTGAMNRPCCLCLSLLWFSASNPVTGAESLAYWCSFMLSLGGVRHLSGLSHWHDLLVRGGAPLRFVPWGRFSWAVLVLVSG